MSWQFIASPPGWWVFYRRNDSERMALPVVAWRLLADNRYEEDIKKNPDGCQPYGDPMIMGGDGILQSAFDQGNYKNYDNGPGSIRTDFRDGWEFDYAEYIPDINGVLKKPSGDCIWWEPTQ